MLRGAAQRLCGGAGRTTVGLPDVMTDLARLDGRGVCGLGAVAGPDFR